MPRLVDDQLFGTDRKVVDPDLIKGGLRSKQFATVLDLLGYGEIDSIFDVGGSGTNTFKKSVFLDGTPLQDVNGNENFPDVEIFFKNGASNQTALQEINAIENTIPVGVEVTKAASVTRSITDTNVDKVRVSIQVPSLSRVADDGAVKGTNVRVAIRITEDDGTVHNVITNNNTKDDDGLISGKALSPYVKDYEIKFTKTMSFPVSITVIRDTPDSTSLRLANKTNWLSFTEINTDTSAYQGFAYVGIRFNAQSFQSYPKRMYRVKGTKILIPDGTSVDGDNGRIIYPDNYVFDGTFKTNKEWCSDPAWILYDLLTTDKGFGGADGIIDADTLDVFSFYSASKYASKEITDPITGTTEPRFSCNVIINQKNDAYTLINDLCSVMNAMPFYSNGSLQISQDRPTNTATNTSDAQYIFNNSNITEEGFTYSGVGQRTKYTEVEVAFFNNDTQTLDYELITASDITVLSDAITKFGRTRKTIKAFACTSRGQANRLGRWFLYSNLKESEVVSFTTTLEAGVFVRPSMIIGIADSLRAGVRRGGRIKSVTNLTTIVVDDANNTDLADTNGASISIIMPTANTNGEIVETRNIDSVNGSVITVSSAFSTAPNVNSIYAIRNTSVEFQIYRVISIEEKNQSEYSITAIIHDTNKYAQVEDPTVAADPRVITTLIDTKPAPSNASASEQIVVLQNRAVSVITVSWEPVIGVKEYLIEYQFENDNVEKARVAKPTFELFESELGSYTFAIKSYNALGKLSSNTTTVSFKAEGKTALPSDVQNLKIETISNELVRLRFDKSTDVDVVHGGTIVIRASNLTDGTGTFSDATTLKEISGNVTEVDVPNIGSGEYIVKFKDDGGRLSSGETSIIYNSPDPFPKLSAFVDREDTDSPAFAGTKTNCSFSSSKSALVLDSTTGNYLFAGTLDLGNKQPLSLKRHLITEGFYSSSDFDDRTALIDTWTSFDQITAIDVDAELLVATTDLDPDTSTAGTYTINDGSGGSGTIITITKSSHGYSVGSFVTVDFTSGTGVDGDYQIISKTTDTFTLTSATSLSTSGNCNYSADFSQYNSFVRGSFVARGFKFKLEMETQDPAQSIAIKQLGYTAELASRTETSLGNAGATNGVFASGTSTKSVSFTNSFFTGQANTSVAANSVKPSIGITIENAQSGDFFTLSNITGTGFDIDIKNGSSNVNRNFKYTATGFGRGS